MTKTFACLSPVSVLTYFVWSCNKNEIGSTDRKKKSHEFLLHQNSLLHCSKCTEKLVTNPTYGGSSGHTSNINSSFPPFPGNRQVECLWFEVSSKDSRIPLPPSAETENKSLFYAAGLIKPLQHFSALRLYFDFCCSILVKVCNAVLSKQHRSILKLLSVVIWKVLHPLRSKMKDPCKFISKLGSVEIQFSL